MTTQVAKAYEVTSREAAAMLGVHMETVKRWAREGRIEGRRNISGRWLFNRDDLDDLPVHIIIESVDH